MDRFTRYAPSGLTGWMAPDAYSTAWVAMVPSLTDLHQPAWPEALTYLADHQLTDGGWGASTVYYAHERTISTAAALAALNLWPDPAQTYLYATQQGLQALRSYARNLADEPHEPVGFELLLPRLQAMLRPTFGCELPLDDWAPIEALSRQKLALIEQHTFDPTQPRAWWFSLEMLPEHYLAQLDDSILNEQGSIDTSTAATAAYLRARRLAGLDSPRAAAYLQSVLEMGGGSVPFCWPAEVYERVWIADSLRRAGFAPDEPGPQMLVPGIRTSWERNDAGLSSSDYFRVNDGDDTLVGFTVLNWAGAAPPEDAALAFWNSNHFRSYLDERSASVSANINALTGLRSQPGLPHIDKAERLADWLLEHRRGDGMFDDKWHYSPYYSLSRAVEAFAGLRCDVAKESTSLIVDQQQADGGWGWFGRSTLEESAHCVLGLTHAHHAGLLDNTRPLREAGRYFRANAGHMPTERFWIGKTLFRPDKIIEATLVAARRALARINLTPFPLPESNPAD